ncbi:MAG TPA: UDP-glucose/GDP-mannose dehydrogenase family protein [Actinomycetota bacterium]|nr:UDP-glucose/GDP-mannose dehydrogenase family protein [Actinomycetota bacterium]
MRVGVIGTGHVGLITCASFAAVGHDVVGTDADRSKIDALLAGDMPFHEPGVADSIREGVAAGRLSFAHETEEAVPEADVVFVCVGTPPRATGEANLVAVEQAARQVLQHAAAGLVIVEKSTVPAGTADRLVRSVSLQRADLVGSVHVVSNPEFLREGHAMADAMSPERILVGASSESAFAVMRALYEPFTDRGARMIETDIRTAELAKHACNAFLALKISYANALARLCERADADVDAVTEVMGADSRIGPAFLNAGLGYGGYCFPKDLVAFDRLSTALGYDFAMLREVQRINDQAVDAAVEKIRDALWNLDDKRIALLGLAFKPGTDDVRIAPALELASRLRDLGATVVGYDPHAAESAVRAQPELEIAPSAYEAAHGAHCAVLCTEWEEFQELDFAKLGEVMATRVFVDGRNAIDADEVVGHGFHYYPAGRRPSIPDRA